jgi:hypothetical protein
MLEFFSFVLLVDIWLLCSVTFLLLSCGNAGARKSNEIMLGFQG